MKRFKCTYGGDYRICAEVLVIGTFDVAGHRSGKRLDTLPEWAGLLIGDQLSFWVSNKFK